jgi:hypothetical protein
LTLNATLSLNQQSLLSFHNTQTLTGEAEILFGNSGPKNRIGIEGASTLTLDSGVLVHGVNGTIGGQSFVKGANRLVNRGTIDADGGGTITLNVNNRAADAVTNLGVLAATHGVLDVHDAVANSGNVFVGTDGAMRVRRYAQSGGHTHVDGKLTVLGNHTLAIEGGRLTGEGIVFGKVAVTGGTISAGASPGSLTVNGSFMQGLDASMLVEWGGSVQGVDYDFIDVNGTATLSGSVVVDILNGFAPKLGASIAFLEFNRRIGSFRDVIGLDPGYAFDITYSATRAFLTVTQVPEVGTWVMFVAGLGLVAFSATRRSMQGA